MSGAQLVKVAWKGQGSISCQIKNSKMFPEPFKMQYWLWIVSGEDIFGSIKFVSIKKTWSRSMNRLARWILFIRLHGWPLSPPQMKTVISVFPAYLLPEQNSYFLEDHINWNFDMDGTGRTCERRYAEQNGQPEVGPTKNSYYREGAYSWQVNGPISSAMSASGQK